MKKSNLETLIHPLNMAQFFTSYSQNTPFVVHHPADFLSELTRLPILTSLESLLNSWPDKIEAHLPDARDEVSAIETNSKEAPRLFANGMGLLFKDAHNFSVDLSKWLENIREDLGISRLTYSRCLIYATPHGKGTAAHFDQNINFVLQIHGTKKWIIAPNNQVESPLTRHTMGHPLDPELSSYAPDSLRMPSSGESFELKPGSLLFVPQGAWHSTEADGDALSLNFTFSAPAWVDLLTAALRGRLIQSPEWRETAVGLTSEEGRVEAQHKFNYLLSTLVQDLPHWRAVDILNTTDELN